MENLNGTWYNELGSVMTIKANGNTISGTYQTEVGDPHGIFNLIGLIDTDNGSSQAVGWVVVWQNQHGNLDSVTTWSGQLQVINGIPTIVTTWLLTQETNLNEDWHSTFVGQDTFTTVQKTQEQIKDSIKRGIKSSLPTKR